MRHPRVTWGKGCDIRPRLHLLLAPGADADFGPGCVLDHDMVIEVRGSLVVRARTIFGHHCIIAAGPWADPRRGAAAGGSRHPGRVNHRPVHRRWVLQLRALAARRSSTPERFQTRTLSGWASGTAPPAWSRSAPGSGGCDSPLVTRSYRCSLDPLLRRCCAPFVVGTSAPSRGAPGKPDLRDCTNTR